MQRSETEKSSEAIRGVLFDLDGTLLDTAPDLAAAVNRMLAELKLPPRSLDEITLDVGQGVKNLVRRALEASGGSAAASALLAAALPIFERCYGEELGIRTRPFAGVVDGLQRMRRLGLALGCVTNKAGVFAQAHLERAGLAPFLDCLLSGDAVARLKPDPMPYLLGCERLKLAPRSTLVIGDSDNDVVAGRAAGCRVWCVPYGYRQGRRVESLACDALIEDLSAAARRLEDLR